MQATHKYLRKTNQVIAIAGSITNALSKSSGEHPDVQGWYAWFLQHVVLTQTSIAKQPGSLNP